MTEEFPDLDRYIDYEDFARRELGRPENEEGRASDEWRYLCPFHNDAPDPSLHFNINKGVYHCKSCGNEGNAVDLYKHQHNLSDEDAFRELAREYNIPLDDEQNSKLTLNTYADWKGLDDDLKEYGLTDGEDGVKMPYMNEEGETVAVRTRKSMRGDDRFWWRKGDETTLYGLWRLNSYRRGELLLLVEGESDCHTLWQYDIPALGLPGKANFKDEWLEYLEEFDEVVILEENGARSEVLEIARRIDTNLKTDVYSLDLPTDDVNDFYRENRQRFKERLDQQLERKDRLDFSQPDLQVAYKCITQDNLRHDGTNFEVNYPYLVDDELYRFKLYKTKAPEKNKVANHPVYLGGRYKDEVDNSIWTEVVWETFNGKESKLLRRGDALSSRKSGIRQLSDYGAPVHTENTKDIVEFLDDFENWNEKQLTPDLGSSQLGWVDEREPLFMLGRNSIGGDCKFIPRGEEEERISSHYEASGDGSKWVKLWDELANPQSRIVVSSLLASPLLRLIGQRSALFYVYGESGIGKTAAGYLGLSAWGNPEKLKATAYSTTVGMERRAVLLNDLPLFIDERQATTSEDFIGRLIYMLSGGQSKSRGKKHGGLEKTKSWRSLALMTGEEDLTDDEWTGIENRTLQLHATDLLSEETAESVYEVTAENYGHVGRALIERLTELGKSGARNVYREIRSEIDGSELTNAKKTTLSTVGTAEYLLLETLDRSPDPALDDTAFVASKLGKDGTRSLAERAREYVFNQYQEYLDQGNKENRASAFINEEKNELWVVSTKFDKWIKEGGFTPKRIKKDCAEKGWIRTRESGGSTRYTIRKSRNGSRGYYVVFDLDEIQEEQVVESEVPF